MNSGTRIKRSRLFRVAMASAMAGAVIASGPAAQAADCMVYVFDPKNPVTVVDKYEEIQQTRVQPRVQHLVENRVNTLVYTIMYPTKQVQYSVSMPDRYIERQYAPFLYTDYKWRWHDYSIHNNHFRPYGKKNTLTTSCRVAWDDPDPGCGGHYLKGTDYLGHDTDAYYTEAWSQFSPTSRARAIDSRDYFGYNTWGRTVPAKAKLTGLTRERMDWKPATWVKALPAGRNRVDYRWDGTTRTVITGWGTPRTVTRLPAGVAGKDYVLVGTKLLNGWGDEEWVDKVAADQNLLETRYGVPTLAEDQADDEADGWVYLATANKAFTRPAVWADTEALELGWEHRTGQVGSYTRVKDASGKVVTQIVQGAFLGKDYLPGDLTAHVPGTVSHGIGRTDEIVGVFTQPVGSTVGVKHVANPAGGTVVASVPNMVVDTPARGAAQSDYALATGAAKPGGQSFMTSPSDLRYEGDNDAWRSGLDGLLDSNNTSFFPVISDDVYTLPLTEATVLPQCRPVNPS